MRPARRWALLLVLAACGGEAAQQKQPPPPEGDLGVFASMRQGRMSLDEGLMRVARSGGWPIADGDGFFVARKDDAQGPYRVVSVDGVFADVPTQVDGGLVWARLELPDPRGVAYRFAGYNGSIEDPWSRVFRYYGTHETALVDGDLPRLERWQAVGGEGLDPRTVRVWVPAEEPWYFLYAHDGQNLFNPAGAYGGWQLQESAGNHTLIVGIDNTPARLSEYAPVDDTIGGTRFTGKAPAYGDLVEKIVRPLIEYHYGVPRRTGVVGSSMGGLVSLFMALRFPGSYDVVGSLSGTVGWGSIGEHERTIIESYAALASCPEATFYLDSGGGPGGGCDDADGDGIQDDGQDASDNYCENLQLKQTLEALGCGERLVYRWAEGAQHNEAAWRPRVHQVLQLLEQP